MQTPAPAVPAATPAAAAADPHRDRYVVRPAGVLTDLLGAAELGEDELLLRLRELGLLTYPSPLLEGLLGELHEVLAVEVLARLDLTYRVLFGQAGRACRAAVVALGVPHAAGGGELLEEEESLEEEGQEEEAVEEEGEEEEDEAEEHMVEEDEEDEVEEEPLQEGSTSDESTEGGPLLFKFRVKDFVVSVERLAWAKERGCPWDTLICVMAGEGGHLEVLKWAWERRCPWDSSVCSFAAENGHLEVLQWARQHVCPWDESTCYAAAYGEAH